MGADWAVTRDLRRPAVFANLIQGHALPALPYASLSSCFFLFPSAGPGA